MTVARRRHGGAEAGRDRRSARRPARDPLAASTPDDRVIIDGLVRAAPGAKVAPQDGTIQYAANDARQRNEHATRRRQRPCASPTSSSIARIFATVLSVFVTLIGLGALAILPVAQYPEIVPPTVQVTTVYPGASAETVARTVATPLEQEINGVENMIYMSSQSTGDGKLTITVTFRIGTDLNVAQMLTQNRVQDALPRLPEDVQRLGVQVRKATPNILLAVHLYSPDSVARHPLSVELRDAARQGRAGAAARASATCRCSGAPRIRDAHLARSGQGRGLRAQRRRGAGGAARAERAGLGRRPEPAAGPRATRPIRSTSQTLGRLSTPEQFADIIVKTDERGRVTRIRDIGRVEIGAADYGSHRLHGPQRCGCRC